MGSIDWMTLAGDRDGWRAVVYTVMNLRIPQNAGNFVSRLGRFSFSEMTLLLRLSYYYYYYYYYYYFYC
jgi:hypothetical protein